MPVHEMKAALLREIGEADDAGFITAMLNYSKALKENVYHLSEAQGTAITEGKAAINRGKYLTDEEAEAELDHFFREKEKKWGER